MLLNYTPIFLPNKINLHYLKRFFFQQADNLSATPATPVLKKFNLSGNCIENRWKQLLHSFVCSSTMHIPDIGVVSVTFP